MQAIVAERGQVTIPKAVRDRLGITPKTVLEFRADRGMLVAVKVVRRDPVDANVPVDVFRDDPVFGPASGRLLGQCLREGVLVACDVVWAETAARFPNPAAWRWAMQTLGVEFSGLEVATAEAAGLV